MRAWAVGRRRFDCQCRDRSCCGLGGFDGFGRRRCRHAPPPAGVGELGRGLRGHRVGDDQGRGDEHDRFDAAVIGFGEPHRDTVAHGELGEHEQPEARVRGQGRDTEIRWGAQHVVEPGELGLGHAHALVADLGDHALADHVAADLDARLRRGEGGGVVDEFGEQVDEVGDDGADDVHLGQPRDPNPGVVQGFADRAAHQVHQRDRVAPLPAGLAAAEDGEVLGVAAFPGGQMIEPEQCVEQRRILLAPFGFVEDLELAVHHDLAAVGDIEEDRLDALAGAGLGDRGADGRGVRVLERPGDLADLVVAEVQHRRFGCGVDHFALVEPAHGLGQTFVGHGEGLPAQPLEPADDAVGQHQRDQEGRDADHQHAAAGVERVRGGGVGLVLGQFLGVLVLRDPDVDQGAVHFGGGVLPVRRRHRQRQLFGAARGTTAARRTAGRAVRGVGLRDQIALRERGFHQRQLLPGVASGELLQPLVLGAGGALFAGQITDFRVVEADLAQELLDRDGGRSVVGGEHDAQGVAAGHRLGGVEEAHAVGDRDADLGVGCGLLGDLGADGDDVEQPVVEHVGVGGLQLAAVGGHPHLGHLAEQGVEARDVVADLGVVDRAQPGRDLDQPAHRAVEADPRGGQCGRHGVVTGELGQGQSAFLLNRLHQLPGVRDRLLVLHRPLSGRRPFGYQVPRCAHADYKQSQARNERDCQDSRTNPEPRSEHRVNLNHKTDRLSVVSR
ncbi:hypothetical protein NONI108955_42830 [Nocardia ninae]